MALKERSDLAEVTKYFLNLADKDLEDQFVRFEGTRQRAFWSLVAASSLNAVFASLLNEVAMDNKFLILVPCLLGFQAIIVSILLLPRRFKYLYSGSGILDEIDAEEEPSRFEDQMIRFLRMREEDSRHIEKILDRANNALLLIYCSFVGQLAVWMSTLWSSLLGSFR